MLCQLVCVDKRYQRMNCFNIREVEALLKGRFFPDLINSHDHKFLLNNSIIGLRFKTNNLDFINSNLLVFFKYGLFTTNIKRTNSLFFKNSYNLNEYFFLNSAASSNFLFSKLNDIIFTYFVLPASLFLDFYIFIIELFSSNQNRELLGINGYLSLIDFSSYSLITIKSELERQLIHIFYIYDTNKTLLILSNWLINFTTSFLDKFLFGFIENNIGIHLYLIRNWPVPTYIEIQTEGGFIEFFVTAVDHFSRRSIILYIRVMQLNFILLLSRLFNYILIY